MRIAIIGAGWYGIHIALSLKKLGHEIILIEKNASICGQISGNFGIRLHAGPHYPRSLKTRESCQRSLQRFIETYPELILEHDYSIYALGHLDSENQPSKVDYHSFKAVCNELDSTKEIDTTSMGYQNLIAAWQVYEPSIAVGGLLKTSLKQRLDEAKICIRYNFNVVSLNEVNDVISIKSHSGEILHGFDYVINATSYQSLVHMRENIPFDINVVYQPCLALMYEDLKPTKKPFSFIVMDGWFPCMMPYWEEQNSAEIITRQYIVTHGKWTIMGSFHTALEANCLIDQLNDRFIEQNIKPRILAEMARFWPEFNSRFKYIGWKGTVLAKLKTEKEFRSAVTYETNKVIHIIPGKISNIFDAEQEVIALINRHNIASKGNFNYVKNGVLDDALQEIIERPRNEIQNTCSLQTYTEIQKSKTYFSHDMNVVEQEISGN